MAVGLFLEVDGAKGESKNTAHEGTTQCKSFRWGAAQPQSVARGGGGGAGLGDFADLTVTALADKVYPALLEYAANGKHISKVTLYGAKMGGKQFDYLKITLSNTVVCTEVDVTGTDGAEVLCTYSFSAGKLETDYSEQTKEGDKGATTTKMFDIKVNK